MQIKHNGKIICEVFDHTTDLNHLWVKSVDAEASDTLLELFKNGSSLHHYDRDYFVLSCEGEIFKLSRLK